MIDRDGMHKWGKHEIDRTWTFGDRGLGTWMRFCIELNEFIDNDFYECI